MRAYPSTRWSNIVTVIDLTAVFGRLTVHLSAGPFGPTCTDKVQSQSPSAVTFPSRGGARLVTRTCHRPVARDSLGPAKDDQRSGSLTAEMQNYVVHSLDMHQQPCRDTKQLQITQIFRSPSHGHVSEHASITTADDQTDETETHHRQPTRPDSA